MRRQSERAQAQCGRQRVFRALAQWIAVGDAANSRGDPEPTDLGISVPLPSLCHLLQEPRRAHGPQTASLRGVDFPLASEVVAVLAKLSATR